MAIDGLPGERRLDLEAVAEAIDNKAADERTEVLAGLPDDLRAAVAPVAMGAVRERIAGAVKLRESEVWLAAPSRDRAVALQVIGSTVGEGGAVKMLPLLRDGLRAVLGGLDRAGGWADAPDAPAPDPQPFEAVDGDEWGDEWPDREWLIPGWLPAGRFGLLSGRGARGKTRLMLQVVASIVAIDDDAPTCFLQPSGPGEASALDALPGVDRTQCGPVLFVSWEDERDEAGRRLAQMRADRSVPAAVPPGRLRWLDVRGEGPAWGPSAVGFGPSGVLTLLGQRIRATAKGMGARLLVLDSLAGAYASSEIDRGLVRRFCSDWDAWGSEVGCAVFSVSHPPKPNGRGDDDSYSGSTDWHGAARFRWTLGPVRTGCNAMDRDGTTKQVDAPALTLVKANYGPPGRPVFLVPSSSGVGWHGALAETAARAAVADSGRVVVGAAPDVEGDDDGGAGNWTGIPA